MAFFVRTYLSLLFTICHIAAYKRPPTITANQSTIVVPENFGLNHKLLTITAIEPNGFTVTISAAGETNNIVTIIQTKHGSTTTGEVFLKQPLDYETKNYYKLNFSALSSDETIPSREMSVPLFVTDINDTPPKFSAPAYRLEINEDKQLSDTIEANISATDPDNGAGGVVSFSLKPAGQASALYHGIFDINSQTGQIELKQPLDYERLTFYKYTIVARNGGRPSLSSSASLLIMVKDVQDTPPIFQRLPYMTTISEDTHVGSVVGRVYAVDGDIGSSHPRAITYSLQNYPNKDNCHDYLKVNSSTGEISVSKVVDTDGGTIKDLNGPCILTVVASEVTTHPSNLSHTSAVLIFSVQDVNDNTPTFSKNEWHGYVQEDVTDTIISIPGNLTVADFDQGENGIMDLSIFEVGGHVPFPGLVPSPAVVYSGANVFIKLVNGFKFDYKVRTSLNLLVKAEDRGTPRRSSFCRLTVHVNETNRFYPVFARSSFQFSLTENSMIGTIVAKIQATDKDSGKYGEIEYALKGASNAFWINQTTGLIYTKSFLDREKQSVYYLTVEARDGGGKVSAASVKVDIIDVNDNRPIFMQPKYEFGITENSTLMSGMDNISVHAVDYDDPLTSNSNVSYYILPRPDALDKHFAINNVTGSIRIVNPFQPDQISSALGGKLDLAVVAYDHGLPSLTSTASVTAFFQSKLVIPSVAPLCDCQNSTSLTTTTVPPYHAVDNFSGQSYVLCQGQEGFIQCEPGKVIRIFSAVYGRTTYDVCPSHHVGSMNCQSSSSTDHAKWSCNGYRRCSLFADSSVFGEPCTGINKYLEVSFHCVDQTIMNGIFG
uniref:Protocadherin Fat 4-like n=1 Tax=Crassostrea virginica TaxID=6565 RepID=A0A8B8CB98_CRAVI|nr:protocadherin Fat 4-like [Crassostrea virginica]